MTFHGDYNNNQNKMKYFFIASLYEIPCLWFKVNKLFSRDEMSSILAEEKLGELLRMDTFTTKDCFYIYRVYFTKIFKNSFTRDLLSTINQNHHYFMSFVVNDGTNDNVTNVVNGNNYFCISKNIETEKKPGTT